MKKVIFLFTLMVAITTVASHKQFAQNGMTEKYTKQATAKDFKGINNSDKPKSKADLESYTQKNAPEGKPQILLLLINDTGQPKWSPSLWWNYKHANPGQPGC